MALSASTWLLMPDKSSVPPVPPEPDPKPPVPPPSALASPILAFNVSSEDAVYAKPVVVVNSEDNPVNTKEVSAGVGG